MKPGEVAIGAAVLALGLAFGFAAWTMPAGGGYVTVGPQVFPAIVAAGLIVCGALLVFQALAGGFRNRAIEDTDPFDPRAFAWVSAGVVVQMLVIGTVGFVIASTVLFLAIARGFGSRRLVRDAIYGAVISIALYLLFTEVLGLALGPRFSSWLGGD